MVMNRAAPRTATGASAERTRSRSGRGVGSPPAGLAHDHEDDGMRMTESTPLRRKIGVRFMIRNSRTKMARTGRRPEPSPRSRRVPRQGPAAGRCLAEADEPAVEEASGRRGKAAAKRARDTPGEEQALRRTGRRRSRRPGPASPRCWAGTWPRSCWTRLSGEAENGSPRPRSGGRSDGAVEPGTGRPWPRPSGAGCRSMIRASFLRPTLTSRIRPTTSRETTASGMTGSRR